MVEAALILATVAALSVGWAALARKSREQARSRADALSGCAHLLENASASIAATGYGVLRGRFCGRSAALTPIAEALAFRRLPQLWIAAAIRVEDGAAGSIEIVRRPTGAEFFTGGAGLPLTCRPPASWPQDTSVRCDRAALGLLNVLELPLREALADPRIKAVTLTPRGVRVVRQAAQGERGAYLLFRATRFDDGGVVPVAEAEAALTLAAGLIEAVTVDVRRAA